MKRKNKICICFGLILLLVAIFYWSKHSHDDKKTLTIGLYTSSSWDVPNGHQYHVLDYAIKKFHQEHPDITVKYEGGIQQSDYRNWLSAKIIADKTPDLIIVPNQDFNSLASEGAFKDLTPFMQKSSLAPSTFYQSTLKAGQDCGRQLALPYEANPTLMVMNKTLLQKLHLNLPQKDWTPQKFYRLCHQVNHTNRQRKYYGVTTSYNWQDAQLAYGNQLFHSDDHNVYLTTDSARQAFSLIENITNDSPSPSVTAQLFDEGLVSFMPLSLAQYRTYTSYPFHITRDNKFSWECTKMPGLHAVKATPMATTLFAISSKAHNVQGAWAFMKLLCTNRSVQREVMRTNMGSSVLPSVVKSEAAQKILDDKVIDYHNLTVTKLDAIMRDGAITPKFKSYNSKLEKLDYQLQNALKAGNLETQLFNIQSQVNQSADE